MSKFNFNIDIEPLKNDNNSLEDELLSKTNHDSKTQKLLYEMHYNCIDLGLPSGILWAKYNLGVDIESLKCNEDWYGDYFAWGEIKPKDKFTWKNYKFARWIDKKLTKYCTNYKYGKVDNLELLEKCDDAAHIILGGDWLIPSEKDCIELVNNTNYEFVYDYNNIPNLNGMILRSKNNNNEIFFPAAGCRYNDKQADGDGEMCWYWSSTISKDIPKSAFDLMIISSGSHEVSASSRYIGLVIRPVLKTK